MAKLLKMLIVRWPSSTFILFVALTSCQESQMTVDIPPSDEPIPLLFLEFDSYAKVRSVELHWDSTPTYNWRGPLYVVDSIRISAARGLNDRSWVVCEGQTSGRDSATIENLRNGQTYYFRLIAFDSTNTIIGEAKPVVTIPGAPLETIMEIEANQKQTLQWVSNLAWSPDGTSIAFVKLESWPQAQIYRHNLATGTTAKLTSFEGDEYVLSDLSWTQVNLIHYTYSPTRTAGLIDYRIWQLSLEDGGQVALTSGPVDFGASRISESEIVFCRGTRDPPNIPQLYTRKLEASESQLLSPDPTMRQYGPAVSLARNEVVFSGLTELGQGLLSLNLSSSTITQLTASDYWNDIQPNWSPNGRYIFFSSNRSGHFEVWVYDSYVGTMNQVTRAEAFGFEHYSPKLDRRGRRIAYIKEMPGAKASLKVSRLANLP